MDIVIIPAYEPDESLIQVVNKVQALSIGRIIVVNDGSSAPFRPLFRKVCDQAVVLNHEENRGKGAGIKTALRYIAENVPEVESVVVIDADGQHRPEDAMELFYHGGGGELPGGRALKNGKNFLLCRGAKKNNFFFFFSPRGGGFFPPLKKYKKLAVTE